MKNKKVFKILSKGKSYLQKKDAALAEIISSIPSPQITSTQNIFHDLMSCIIEQQIHYRSSKKTFQKLLDKADLEILSPDNFSIFEEKALRETKLSMKKQETLVNILESWNSGATNWEKCEEAELRQKLSEIKGIGKWTIDMILIYTLQSPNIFSYDDFHIKQIMTSLYGLNPKSRLKAQMVEIAEEWSPYLSTAFLYLLEWKKFKKEIENN